jgi:hypothetical protein
MTLFKYYNYMTKVTYLLLNIKTMKNIYIIIIIVICFIGLFG